MEDPFAALKAAETAEFTPPATAAPDSPSSEAEIATAPTDPEPAGEIPPAEEPAPLETQSGDEPEAPSETAGTPPAGEEPASETDDYSVALRAAGGDPDNIPKKLRETLDAHSKVSNELATLKRENAARAAAPAPVQPAAPAQPAATAPVPATAPAPAVKPDAEVIKEQIDRYLAQDADYTQEAQSHFRNLVERVNIVGGTDSKGQPVKGRLSEVREEIADLERYTPERMKARGITLDEFALSQFNPDRITNDLFRLRSEEATLRARDVTLQLENQIHWGRMTDRQNLITQHVTARVTSASSEDQRSQQEEEQAISIASKWNESLASLAKEHGLEDAEEIVNASLRAQKVARQRPDEAIKDPTEIIREEVKKGVVRMDKFKRDGARAVAERKTAATRPMAPAGPAAVASAPRPSSIPPDPFADLKQADKARYAGAPR